jgi:hypothetical protein
MTGLLLADLADPSSPANPAGPNAVTQPWELFWHNSWHGYANHLFARMPSSPPPLPTLSLCAPWCSCMCLCFKPFLILAIFLQGLLACRLHRRFRWYSPLTHHSALGEISQPSACTVQHLDSGTQHDNLHRRLLHLLPRPRHAVISFGDSLCVFLLVQFKFIKTEFRAGPYSGLDPSDLTFVCNII